jgi:adsorption protein B
MATSLLVADFFAFYFLALKVLLAVVATLIFLSGLDDFFIDLYFIGRALYRRLFILPRITPMTRADLETSAEQPVAILVPAWAEAGVIEAMLTNALNSYRYARYVIFVGTYANDPDTAAIVRRLAARHDNLVHAPLGHAGPTNKADCLNGILGFIRGHERSSGENFEIFVIHDAEDIVPPLELALFNRLIPRKDMVQLPVLPLEQPGRRLTGGHYMDEFAETHFKDLAVRESLTGAVPSAGVGCGYSRRAIEAVAAAHGGAPFNCASVAEDYDFSLRITRLGLSQIFVRLPLARCDERASGAQGTIATREYFPTHFRAATRQKTRWLLGVALQGWSAFGWRGSWRMKYILMRDRKGLITAQINMLAYWIALNLITYWAFLALQSDTYRYPPLVEAGSGLWVVLAINGLFLVNRLVMRAFFVWRYYGPWQAALSAPRQIWGNIINFVAATRALAIFSWHILSDRPVAWDKTEHCFPDLANLPAPQRWRTPHPGYVEDAG